MELFELCVVGDLRRLASPPILPIVLAVESLLLTRSREVSGLRTWWGTCLSASCGDIMALGAGAVPPDNEPRKESRFFVVVSECPECPEGVCANEE